MNEYFAVRRWVKGKDLSSGLYTVAAIYHDIQGRRYLLG